MWLLVHHTGATGWPVPGYNDSQNMAKLQSYSIGAGKTWEYNYVITYPDGVIWEMAGEFQSAHCLNANSWAYGVQINQADSHGPPGPAQVESFRWLRQELVNRGQLAPNHNCVPHYYLRSTACSANDLSLPPGPRWASPTGEGSLGSVRPELLVPWSVPPAPDGRLIVTPEDKAYLDGKFSQLNTLQAEDRRGCWRAPEMNNIMRDRANEGAFDAIRRSDLVNAIVAAIVAQVGHVDPAVIKDAIVQAMAGVTVPVDSAAIADAVVDELRGRLEA
jgi:hypothetical protein